MQDKIEEYDSPPPSYSLREHATHGCSHPPSLAQMVSYLVIGYTVLVYLLCTMSLSESTALLVLFCVFLGSLVISAGIATVMDPTDRVVYYYKWSRYDKKVGFSPEYDKILYC